MNRVDTLVAKCYEFRMRSLRTSKKPMRLADLVRPHKVLVPEPVPVPAIVARTPPRCIPDGCSWHQEDQINRPPIPTFDPTKMRLYLSPLQEGNGRITGYELRVDLEGVPVLGTDALDRLLAEPLLIPDYWKGKWVFFWGDVFRDADGDLFVRFLYWFDGRWKWNYSWLNGDWNLSHPAAVVAS